MDVIVTGLVASDGAGATPLIALTGVIHPDEVISNSRGGAGDVLVLTKPLGVGAVVTARKRGLRDDALLLVRAIEAMTTLNDVSSHAARDAGVHA